MSWARFSENSDLYIFDDVHGGITCCACRLQELHETILPGLQLPGDFNCRTEEEMIAHIREHKEAGHNIPEGLLDE